MQFAVNDLAGVGGGGWQRNAAWHALLVEWREGQPGFEKAEKLVTKEGIRVQDPAAEHKKRRQA
jgi:hypothetical protein